jgi:hypothetical protein
MMCEFFSYSLAHSVFINVGNGGGNDSDDDDT